MTVCATCLLNLVEVNQTLRQDADLRKKINGNLAKIGLEYRGNVEVTHLLWVLCGLSARNNSGENSQTPARPARRAVLRLPYTPAKDVLGFDDPDSPTSLDTLIHLLGAESVSYDGKKRCCGFHVLMTSEDIALKLSGKRLSQARDAQADCVVTTCPLCHSSLDPYQAAVESKLGTKINLPSFTCPSFSVSGLASMRGNSGSTATRCPRRRCWKKCCSTDFQNYMTWVSIRGALNRAALCRDLRCCADKKPSVHDRRSWISPCQVPTDNHNRVFCTDVVYLCRRRGWRAQRASLLAA